MEPPQVLPEAPDHHHKPANMAGIVLGGPDPPTAWAEMASSINCVPRPEKPVTSFLRDLFPILGRSYSIAAFRSDLMAGLTLASLGIPQSIGYANLAKLDPQYGLYTSVVPPLIYAVMGTSRELAIGPVAVVSLLLPSMIQHVIDPTADPASYRKIVFTVTLLVGIFQTTFGLFRLGFIVDFLSHATIVGFMAGAAIVIGLQQLKGLFALTRFTNRTDIISVISSVVGGLRKPDEWHPYNFLIGTSFLILILIARFIGRRNRRYFWVSAVAPLLAVVLSTVLIFVTRADQHGVKIIQHVAGGLNRSSIHDIQLNGPHAAECAKIALVCALIALTEAVAVGRSFASVKGYQLDGNKEMIAMGVMNMAGSLSSCYVATGSFSRTAVNFSAGCTSTVSNIVMAVTVLVAMLSLTRLLYFTPVAILASIVLSALPGLIDLKKMHEIWSVDKSDFLACAAAFFGVLFGSVEIGLSAALIISFAKIVVKSIRPPVELLGRLPGTDVFRSVRQYPMAHRSPDILLLRIDGSLSFLNANFVRERIIRWAETQKEAPKEKKKVAENFHSVVIDMSNVVDIDFTGISALGELQKQLTLLGMRLALANPGWHLVQKMKVAGLVNQVGTEWIFLTVSDALDTCVARKDAAMNC